MVTESLSSQVIEAIVLEVIFDEKVITQTVSNFPVNINSDADDHESI